MELSKKLTNSLSNNDVNNCTKNNDAALVHRQTAFVNYQIDILQEGMNFCQRRNDSIKRSQVANKSSGDNPFDLQAAWADIQQTCAFNSGKPVIYSLSYIDNPIGTPDALLVAINAPGGKVYFLPYNATSTIELDTATDTTTVITGTQSHLTNAPRIRGACYADGSIYCSSGENKMLYRFDISTKTYSALTSTADGYFGLAYDGSTYIYSLGASTSNKILRYNVKSDAIEEIASLTADRNKYQRILLHPNGKLYASPQYYTKIIEIDPADLSNPTYFSTYINRSLYCCLTPNGDIAIAPVEGTGTQKFAYANVTNKTVTFEAAPYSSGNTWAWFSNIILTPTGKPVAAPQSFPEVVEYDSINNSHTIVGSTIYSRNSNANYYGSAILAKNGCIFCCPGSTANVKILKISINIEDGKNFKESTILSPYLNKY